MSAKVRVYNREEERANKISRLYGVECLYKMVVVFVLKYRVYSNFWLGFLWYHKNKVQVEKQDTVLIDRNSIICQ